MNDIEALMSRIRSAVDRELKVCAEDLLSKSRQIVPVGDDEVRKRTGVIVKEGGALYESGFVEERHESMDIRVVVVGYDTRRVDEGSRKKDFNYAILQHEKPMPHDDGEWKFLETPYKENKDRYEQKIGSAVGNNLDRVTLNGGFELTTRKGAKMSRSFD